MDVFQLTALIIVALIIVATIIAYRKRLSLVLKFIGINLNIEAENEAIQNNSTVSTGVKIEDAKSTGGGLSIEEGYAYDSNSIGIDVKSVEVKDDIIIGKGSSGSPKTDPPA